MTLTLGPGEWYSLACALAWASAVILFKKSGESLAPFALNLLKNVIGLVLMVVTIAVVSPHWPDLPGWSLPLAIVSGVLGIGIGDTLYFRGLNAIGAGRMAVAQTMYSPFVIILSVAFLAERLNAWQLAGVVVVLAGVVLATYTRGATRIDARAVRIGVAYAVAAVFVMAAGVVMAKPLLEAHDFLWIVMLRIAGGTVAMLMVVAVQRSAASLLAEFRAVRHWPQVIAGSVLGTYVSMLLWLAGYKYTQASIAAVLNELAAVFMIVMAALALKEHVTRRQVAGCALALAGVFLVVLR